MKLLIFATLDEAAATIKHSLAKQIDSDCYQYSYQNSCGKIVISGIGSYAAQMAVAKYGIDACEIINFGFAASLKTYCLGEILSCSIVGKYTPLPESLDQRSSIYMEKAIPIRYISEIGCRLISSDFPIHSEKLRETLNSWDLLDMEGYGIAFAATYLGKKCTLYKVVSDFAKANGRIYIEKHKRELSKKLSEVAL